MSTFAPSRHDLATGWRVHLAHWLARCETRRAQRRYQADLRRLQALGLYLIEDIGLTEADLAAELRREPGDSRL